MTSLSRIVLSRWAMVKLVRPWRSVARADLDRGLGPGVDAAGRLVQDQDAGIGQDRPGEGDELALALAQPTAARAKFGVVALRQALDELVGVHGPCRRFDLLLAWRPSRP